MSNKMTIAVTGNPNCGKTTLFNALTGSSQYVGNWPGVTVEQKSGVMKFAGAEIEVVDTPGIYSMTSFSIDEKVTRDYILSGQADVVLNIIDATNVERSLYLLTQLLEMRVPVVVALNMMDAARRKKIKIEIEHFALHLGCPVVPIVASLGKNLDALQKAIMQQLQEKKISSAKVVYDEIVEEQIQELLPLIADCAAEQNVDARWLAIKALEDDEFAYQAVPESLDSQIKPLVEKIEKHTGEDADLVIADGKYGFINGIAEDVVNRSDQIGRSVTEAIDKIVLHRIIGIPLFLAVMYLVFWASTSLAAPFIDFFDGFAGTIFVDGFGVLLAKIGTPEWLNVLLAGGVGGGIQTVATFIPPIFFVFLCLSILEDSGYMARAAFVMDRLMKVIGLPGKSFVPMLVGFGCTVPAIMATRTLESRKDRFLTIMMAPFMSCGARLPVYVLFGAAFFPHSAGKMVFSIYLIGILLAIFTGFLMKKSLLKGEVSTFVMELPSYHIPTARGILFHTWQRLKVFILRAGKAIMMIVVILSFLNSIGTDGSFGNDDSGKSVLSAIGKAITPVFAPMGIQSKNWPATVGLFTGIFAKEAVVGTLNSLYEKGEQEERKSEDGNFDFWAGIEGAFDALGSGLSGIFSSMGDPLGFAEVGQNQSQTAQDLAVRKATFGDMLKKFGSTSAAYAYLLFVLIYVPCVAAVGAIYRETTLAWTVLVSSYLTILAWCVATVYYQLANFFAHPGSSSLIILLTLGGFASGMFLLGKYHRPIED